MYEGEIVGELDPKKITVQELGLYMAGAKRDTVKPIDEEQVPVVENENIEEKETENEEG